jgi:hypothetical protein
MRSSSALILLAALVTLSSGCVLAQDASNATIDLNAANETAATDVAPVTEAVAPLTDAVQTSQAAPQETPSKFKQLSTFVKGATTILGKNAVQEYSDVSKTANRDTVFTRDAGVSAPAVKVGITKVSTGDDKYIQVTNKAVGAWDLMGWTLASAGSTTFTFPSLTLDEGALVRVHEGEGSGSNTDIYSNSTEPLWTDNLVSLQDADGTVISTYDISAASAESAWVDPLASQIQY